MQQALVMGVLLGLAGFAAAAEPIGVSRSTVALEIVPSVNPDATQAIREWVQASAQTVAAYYGYFPVSSISLIVHTDSRGAISDGVTYAARRIEIGVGPETQSADFRNDWELIHEMFHLALPSLDEDHTWIGEGFSDYLEPIARVRAGRMTIEEFWRQMLWGLPKGIVHQKNRGLNGTRQHDRIYWGGALFWFLVDIEARNQSHNHRSIHTVAQAILDAGGNGRAEWEVDRVIAVGDNALQQPILRDFYHRMGSQPYTPNLDEVWRKLGVISEGRTIRFDDDAPWGTIRQGMTARD